MAPCLHVSATEKWATEGPAAQRYARRRGSECPYFVPICCHTVADAEIAS